MSKNTSGFFLIAYLVYVTILMVIIALSIRLSLLLIPQMYNLINWSSYTDFYVIHDILYKNFCCAPHRADAWYKFDNEGFIWHTGSQDYGWVIENKNLLYKEGTYTTQTKKWSSVTTSLMVRDVCIDSANIIIKDNFVYSVSCSISKNNKKEHRWYCERIFT